MLLHLHLHWFMFGTGRPESNTVWTTPDPIPNILIHVSPIKVMGK